MTVERTDNLGIVVEDLDAAAAQLRRQDSMKALGFIAELENRAGHSFPGLPALADVAGRLDPKAKASVLEYLAHGVQFFDVMEASPDPLNPGRSIPGGPSLVTDGEWVWRLDLANYISAHDVELPDDFIARAIAAVQSRSFPVVTMSMALTADALSAAGWATGESA